MREDLEDILKDIRNCLKRYKRDKNVFTKEGLQDIRDELAVNRAMLADIGGDLYADKLEEDLKFENARYKLECDLEDEYRKTKTPNAAERAKREARVAISGDAMVAANRINRLASNLYMYTIGDVLNSIASRLASMGTDNYQNTPRQYEHREDEFASLKEEAHLFRETSRAEKDLHGLGID